MPPESSNLTATLFFSPWVEHLQTIAGFLTSSCPGDLHARVSRASNTLTAPELAPAAPPWQAPLYFRDGTVDARGVGSEAQHRPLPGRRVNLRVAGVAWSRDRSAHTDRIPFREITRWHRRIRTTGRDSLRTCGAAFKRGLYVGKLFRHRPGFFEPGSRDSDCTSTERDAARYLYHLAGPNRVVDAEVDLHLTALPDLLTAPLPFNQYVRCSCR